MIEFLTGFCADHGRRMWSRDPATRLSAWARVLVLAALVGLAAGGYRHFTLIRECAASCGALAPIVVLEQCYCDSNTSRPH